MDVGKRITALREARQLTTNRLANLCGLSQSFVRAVELGEKGISVENLELLCNALHVSLHEFFAPPQQNAEDCLRAFLSSLTPPQRQLLEKLVQTIR